MKAIFFIFLLPTLVWGADKVEIVNRVGSDQMSIAGDKVEISTGSFFQVIASGTITVGGNAVLDVGGSTQTKSGSLFLGGQLQASSGTIKGNFSMGNGNKIVFANPDNEYIGESGDVIQTVSFDSVETYLDSNADSTSAFRIFSEGLAGGGTIRLTLRDDGALVL